MCGICGQYNYRNGEPVTKDFLLAGNNTMKHRGPDDEGYFSDGPIGLAMRRLSIIDLPGGKQPVCNEDRSVWIVFNGEIFNYQELRSSLIGKGHTFGTNSDTETIVHLYEEFGAEAVHHLRGMFSFALWDAKHHTLLLVRDRLGIKPLFYSIIGDSEIVFASEMKALLKHPRINKAMNFQALDAFFTYGYVPCDLTIYRGIQKLLPGHMIEVNQHGVVLRKYWDLYFRPDYQKTEEDFKEQFIQLFADAVRMRLVSDVPLGAFLSGGVDSSLVVANMARNTAGPLRTFTVGFGAEATSHIDERPFARMLALHYGCLHKEIEVKPDVETILDEIIDAFDEPFADDSVIPTYYICEKARRDVTVALTGLGGDELFSGYERYLGLQISQLFDSVPRVVTDRVVSPLINSLPEQRSGRYLVNHIKRFVAASALPIHSRYQRYLSTLPENERRQLFSGSTSKEIDFRSTENIMTAYYAAENASTPLDRAFYQDIKTYLPEDILALTDRIGMLHSLELRVPFTDHILVEFCATIPAGLKLKHLRKKHLLKEVAVRFMPERIINHPKQGFSSPIAQWLKGDLRSLCDRLLSREAIERQGIFDWRFVQRAIEEHVARKRLNDKLLFSLIVFQKWCEKRPDMSCPKNDVSPTMGTSITSQEAITKDLCLR